MLDKTKNNGDHHLEYKRLTDENDSDIPFLLQMYKAPEISRYISIDEKNYFSYVTRASNVYFFKVYTKKELVGAIHLETQEQKLFMDIAVIPEYQQNGVGTAIIKDIQNGTLSIDYHCIEVSIDEENIPSRKLFEKMGFTAISKDDELINYIYEKHP